MYSRSGVAKESNQNTLKKRHVIMALLLTLFPTIVFLVTMGFTAKTSTEHKNRVDFPMVHAYGSAGHLDPIVRVTMGTPPVGMQMAVRCNQNDQTGVGLVLFTSKLNHSRTLHRATAGIFDTSDRYVTMPAYLLDNAISCIDRMHGGSCWLGSGGFAIDHYNAGFNIPFLLSAYRDPTKSIDAELHMSPHLRKLFMGRFTTYTFSSTHMTLTGPDYVDSRLDSRYSSGDAGWLDCQSTQLGLCLITGSTMQLQGDVNVAASDKILDSINVVVWHAAGQNMEISGKAASAVASTCANYQSSTDEVHEWVAEFLLDMISVSLSDLESDASLTLSQDVSSQPWFQIQTSELCSRDMILDTTNNISEIRLPWDAIAPNVQIKTSTLSAGAKIRLPLQSKPSFYFLSLRTYFGVILAIGSMIWVLKNKTHPVVAKWTHKSYKESGNRMFWLELQLEFCCVLICVANIVSWNQDHHTWLVDMPHTVQKSLFDNPAQIRVYLSTVMAIATTVISAAMATSSAEPFLTNFRSQANKSSLKQKQEKAVEEMLQNRFSNVSACRHFCVTQAIITCIVSAIDAISSGSANHAANVILFIWSTSSWIMYVFAIALAERQDFFLRRHFEQLSSSQTKKQEKSMFVEGDNKPQWLQPVRLMTQAQWFGPVFICITTAQAAYVAVLDFVIKGGPLASTFFPEYGAVLVAAMYVILLFQSTRSVSHQFTLAFYVQKKLQNKDK